MSEKLNISSTTRIFRCSEDSQSFSILITDHGITDYTDYSALQWLITKHNQRECACSKQEGASFSPSER